MSDPPETPAAARYKDITALADGATRRLAEHEEAKAARLAEDLAAARERAGEADAQRERVAEGVRVRWNAAMEALWEERWMRVTRMPEAAASAPAAGADEAIREVQAAYWELHDALRKSRWPAPFRRRR